MKFILLILSLSVLTFFVGKQSHHAEQDPVAPEVIHPRFRLDPAPRSGQIARTNPPIFLIPLEKGKKVNRYSFRLSQDPNFKEEVLESNDVPFAIYNPHEKLSLGTWFWQYKYQEGTWSDVLDFTIGATTEDFLTPTAKKLVSLIPKSHPRSIIDQADLQVFKARNQGSADAEKIIDQADKYRSKEPPVESSGIPTLKGSTKVQTNKLALDASKKLGAGVRAGLDPLVKAYLLTGDPNYAEVAISWANKVARWDPNGVSMINNFGDSDCMLSLAMVYDACFDLLTDEEKEYILKSIKVRGNRFYNIWINNLEAKVFSGHVWQHILERLFKTAIATIGEIPEAESWLTFIYEVWQARSPVLGPEDGGWWNGSHYFELNTLTLLEIPLILKQLTSVDFLRSSFYQQNSTWLIYSFPPNSYSEGFGNGTEKQFGQKTGVLAYADVLGRLNQDPLATFYADEHFKAMNLTLSDDHVFRWFRMRWELPERPPAITNYNLPLAKDFRETGTANMHTDLMHAEDDLMVSFRSSPYGSTSHAHADQNAYNIQFGGTRLFYNSGYRPSMGVPHYNEWFKATKGHNTVLIDGKGQPIGSGESYGWIARFLHGQQISYVLGDASKAYDNLSEVPQTTGLQKFRRHLVLLRPNIVVVYDELQADHDAEWSWLLHSMDETTYDGNQLSCKTNTATGLVNIFGSNDLDVTISTKFDPAPVNFRGIKDEDGDLLEYQDQWHVSAKPDQSVGGMRYLAIIQIYPNHKDIPSQIAVQQQKEDRWNIGTWSVKAELNISKEPRLIIENKQHDEALYYGAEEISFGGDKYFGKGQQSTILMQLLDGEVVVKESLDELPLGRDQ